MSRQGLVDGPYRDRLFGHVPGQEAERSPASTAGRVMTMRSPRPQQPGWRHGHGRKVCGSGRTDPKHQLVAAHHSICGLAGRLGADLAALAHREARSLALKGAAPGLGSP